MAELLDEVLQEGDFEFVPRREVGMAALTGPDMVFSAIPVKPRLAEAGAG